MGGAKAAAYGAAAPDGLREYACIYSNLHRVCVCLASPGSFLSSAGWLLVLKGPELVTNLPKTDSTTRLKVQGLARGLGLEFWREV